jgi:hypothetical protein
MSKRKQQQRKARPHDATFWRDGTYAARPYWWWRAEPPSAWAGWKKWGLGAAGGLLVYGMGAHRMVTEWALALTCGPAAGVAAVAQFRKLQGWGHHRLVVRPLAYRLAGVIDQPVSNPRAWIDVPPDYQARDDAEIVIEVPPDFTAAEQDMKDITRAVTVTTGWLAPDAGLQLKSRHPRLVYTKSLPPPEFVTLADIRAEIGTAAEHEVILGLGKKRAVTSLSIDTDTPHLAASMGSGDGKSTFAMNMAAQLAFHGAFIVILDQKALSHMWANGLPNVAYADTPEDIHELLCWLAFDDRGDDGRIVRPSEITRRKRLGKATADLSGEVHGDVGPRVFVLAEELNALQKELKRIWRHMGGKGPSPAAEALDVILFTGRQFKVHVLQIAQRLSAKASGSDGTADSRENIGAIVFKDAKEQTWKLLADGHAQPPKSGHPGRYQLVTRKEVTEFQGVMYDRDKLRAAQMARELAMAGAVAEARWDMPFVYRGPLLVPAGVGQEASARQEGSEQGFVLGPEAGVLTAGEGPGRALTLAKAAAAGIFVSVDAARKAQQRHGWEPVGGTKAGGFKYRVEDLYAYKLEQEKR